MERAIGLLFQSNNSAVFPTENLPIQKVISPRLIDQIQAPSKPLTPFHLLFYFGKSSPVLLLEPIDLLPELFESRSQLLDKIGLQGCIGDMLHASQPKEPILRMIRILILIHQNIVEPFLVVLKNSGKLFKELHGDHEEVIIMEGIILSHLLFEYLVELNDSGIKAEPSRLFSELADCF